ncbi:MAG: putative zinc-binding protein [Opitutales bacterium]
MKTTDKNGRQLPLVYSCSGASSAAQMTNRIAVKLDRMGIAEMSCIAGVGGDVTPLVKVAKSRRPIVAVDGCPLKCAVRILKRHGLQPDKHYESSEMGVKKIMHEDFDTQEAEGIIHHIAGEIRLWKTR